jgi:hypothetical protein
MEKVAFLDVISLVAGLSALVIIAVRSKQYMRRDINWLWIALLLAIVIYNGFMCIEWLGINHTLNSFEDMTGALLPMMWAFLSMPISANNQ